MSERVFVYLIEGESAEQINLFPRYNLGEYNLDGRYSTGAGAGENYLLVLEAQPSLVEVGNQTTIRIFGTMLNGQPMTGLHTVHINTDNPTIGLVPEEVSLSAGYAQFGIVALAVGTATISATVIINGVGYTSNVATFQTFQYDAPVNYSATGYGRVVFSVEPVTSVGLSAKVQRLSMQEQQLINPHDTGLDAASYFGAATVVFMPNMSKLPQR